MSTAIAVTCNHGYVGTAVAVANPPPMANHLELVRRAAEALRTREKAVDEAREKLRQRIIDAAGAGESRSAIARAAGVSRQWISRLLEKR
jgi:DNA invertase Pin-like site-specific DNA recombinase